MKNDFAPFLFVALGGFGLSCSGHWPAPPGAELGELPELTLTGWDPCECTDGTLPTAVGECPSDCGDPSRYNLVVPLSVSVLDGETGYGLNNIEVNFYSSSPNIYVLPESVIEIAIPEGSEGEDLMNDPESGWYDEDPSDGYPYAEFIGEFEDGLSPTFYQAVTNGSGVARAWIWIESMPITTEGEVGSASVLVDIGVDTQVFTIEADEG